MLVLAAAHFAVQLDGTGDKAMKANTYHASVKGCGLDQPFLNWLIHDAPDEILALLRVVSVSRKKMMAMVVFEGTTRFVPCKLADRIEAAREALRWKVATS